MTKSKSNIYQDLKQLGDKTNYQTKPSEAKLEKVKNPHEDVDYVVRFTCPEFTSLCPVTGQPDFAHIVIDYVPNKFLVESKALKLLMFSYRNHAGFHEECTVDMAKKIINFVKPKYLRIGGYWYPRGGIPIDIFFQSGKLPNNVWLPETGVAPYKGRG